MKRIYFYILFALVGFSFVAGCNKMEEDFFVPESDDARLISPYCLFDNNKTSDYSSGRLSTKALINQSTYVDTILCNFLRIEENENSSFAGTYSDVSFTTNWSAAYLSEGSISTVPNSQTGYLRSIALHPEQPYNTTNPSRKSRMVGWYPRTTDVPQTAQGTDVSIQFYNFSNGAFSFEDSKIGVKFTGLDGSKDVMVSDVRDGSYSQPFSSLPGKKNIFTFKHYLSAVRIYAKAERSSQDIGMWGEIENVIIMRQPTSCIVELPQEPADVNSKTGFSESVIWGEENAKFPIQKTHLFGEHDTGNPENIVAEEYPIKLDGHSTEKYLGYSLVQPNCTLRVQIHTNAGIYDVEIPPTYNSAEIFKPGCIYDLHLDFKTDGTIFTFLEKEGSEKYFDLTKGVPYRIDSDGDGDEDSQDDVLYVNKYANCYVIYSDPDGTEQDTGGSVAAYDGFCFDASVVGNGESGIISTGAQSLYPTNAHIKPVTADILWETSPRLVTQVELLYDHIRFKVAKNGDGTFKEGNAVLAAYDKDKKILWSWHIWITDKPSDFSYTEVSTTISIMDRNLGATRGPVPDDGNDTQALETYGLYYQWGRKDPSMGPPSWDYSPINMTTAPFYDYSSDMRTSAEVMRFAQPTLQDAVENPMYLIMPTAQTQTYYFNWLYQKIDFLWGYSVTSGNTHKTIYDPCPYGYRVSGGELADLFTYATTSSSSSIERKDYGQNIKISDKNIFFPYSGFKGVDRGLNSLVSSWRYVGNKGDYQSAIVSRYTDDEEYYMHRSRVYISKDRTWTELNVGQYTGYQIEDHTNRRTAAPVRCVKDENHNRISAFLTPDKYTISNSNGVINFKLFAESFIGKISSARLVLGYHLKQNVGVHKDTVLAVWNNINNKQWSVPEFKYEFSDHFMEEDGKSGKIDITTTTGEFRFILYVKTEDNVNKMSSTTIKLADNSVDLEPWRDDEEKYFVGEPVLQQFRIYGDSRPVKVEMIVNNNESSSVNITSNLSVINGSEYTYDYYCSTSGLVFNTVGTHNVHFKVTFESGEEITTESKDIIVSGISINQLSSVSSISPEKYYVIQNSGTSRYVYDGGTNISTSQAVTFNNLFRFEEIRSGVYKISSVATSDYVHAPSNYTLNMTEKSLSAATEFTVVKNSNYFNIYLTSRSGAKYHWRQQNNNSNISLNSSANNDNARWIIYEVTATN